MNERIRELEKQATEIVKCGLNGTSTAESFNRKKFAELIVKECLVVINQSNGVGDDDVIRISRDVKKHFGLTEREE